MAIYWRMGRGYRLKMEQIELAYIVRIKTWEDSPKVRADYEKRLVKICELNFNSVCVDDANDMGVV